MIGRSKSTRTHSQQVMDELAQSYGHLRMAAGHAAGGTAEMVTPPYDRARFAAARGWISAKGMFAPMYEQVREGAANARRSYLEPTAKTTKTTAKTTTGSKRWPVLVGLLAAGTAVGAAGAMVAKRRRNAAQWDEYEPLAELDDTAFGLEDEALASSSGASKVSRKMSQGVASVADQVASGAGKMADSLRSSRGTVSEAGTKAARKAGDAADRAASKAADTARDTSSKASDVAAEARDKSTGKDKPTP